MCDTCGCQDTDKPTEDEKLEEQEQQEQQDE